jgi:hypothetical protein
VRGELAQALLRLGEACGRAVGLARYREHLGEVHPRVGRLDRAIASLAQAVDL